jgi:hypothetical protein
MLRRSLGSAARRTLLLVSLLWLAVPAWGAVPGQINFQGLLLDSGGQPVNGAVSLSFTLYDAETHGTALWTESHTGVQVLDGVYDVALGSLTPIAAEVLAAGSVWVEVMVGGEKLTPRKQVLAVPYALRAETAETALSADSVATPPIPPVIGFLNIIGETIPVHEVAWAASYSNSQIIGNDLVLTVDNNSLIPGLIVALNSTSSISNTTLYLGPSLDVDDVRHQISIGKSVVTSVSQEIVPEVGGPHLVTYVLDMADFTVSNFSADGEVESSVSWDFEMGTGPAGSSCDKDPIIYQGDSSHDFSNEPNPAFVSQIRLPASTSSWDYQSGNTTTLAVVPLSITLDYDGPCFLPAVLMDIVDAQMRVEVWTAASGELPQTTLLYQNVHTISFTLFSVGDRIKQTVVFESTNSIDWQVQGGL